MKLIEGYGGRYSITEDGKVFSNRGGKLKELVQLRMGVRGHLAVSLSYNGWVTTCQISQLVAKAYLENPEGKKQIKHLDGDPTNNHYSNLVFAGSRASSITPPQEPPIFPLI